ncbi:hypothetical protein F4803DRAFT_546729 [Xylaria telfairii]|nr:hypothetical protein F4803DRAFT_546729 [Xylaria telfairii]
MPAPNFDGAKATASESLRFVAKGVTNATEWAATNPKQAAVAGVGAACVVAPMLVVAPVLSLVGFGANGIVGGSIAAGIQSGIGNVVAPSLFATLQSAAAGGYGVATVAATVQGLGVTAGSACAAMSAFNNKKHYDQDADDQETEEHFQDQYASQEHHGDMDMIEAILQREIFRDMALGTDSCR